MISRSSFIGAALGTLIEYYDYALISIFLPIIAPLFFPGENVYQSLSKCYFVLMIAFFSRPLGGLFFGIIGDKLGRKKALMLAIYGIAIATFALGLIPTYQHIGWFAIFLLMFCKIIQVFCFGGEYNGAGIYIVEHAGIKMQSTFSGLLTAMTLSGGLLASIIGIILTLKIMPHWSWRVAFFLGGLLGFWTITYRRKMLESPHFIPADPKIHTFKKMCNLYRKELTAGIFIGGLATVPYTTVLTFINPVLTAKGLMTTHQLMLLQTFMITISIITTILAGLLADKFNASRMMKLGCLLLVFLSYPALLGLDINQFYWIIIGEIVILTANEIQLAPAHAYLKSIFAMQFRYRASSISFCLGMSVFGGLTPVVENWLYQLTHHFSIIFIWPSVVALGTYISMVLVSQKQNNMETNNLSVAIK